MQSPLVNPQSLDSSLINDSLAKIDTSAVESAGEDSGEKPFQFQAEFKGYMDMYSNLKRVSEYLQTHQHWFKNCAHPIQAESLGENGYALTLGRFAALGYEVEPKFALALNSLSESSYRLETISLPAPEATHYEVDYQALIELREVARESRKSKRIKIWQRRNCAALPTIITRVQWQLDLKVAVKFPKFIHKLPNCLIQTSGDRLLTQIVAQVSPYLTHKVQQDFHTRFELPIPAKNSRHCQRISPQTPI